MYTAGRKFYKDSLEKSTYFLAENFYDYFYFLDFNLPLQVIIGGGGCEKFWVLITFGVLSKVSLKEHSKHNSFINMQK